MHADGAVDLVPVEQVKQVDSVDTDSFSDLRTLFNPLRLRIVRCEENSDGTWNLFTDVAQVFTPSTLTTGEPALGDLTADADTVFVMFNASISSYDVYTGIENVPSYTDVAGFIAYIGTKAKIVFAYAATNPDTLKEYAYIVCSTPVYHWMDGKGTYTYEAVVDGMKTTIAVGPSILSLDIGLYTYSHTLDGSCTFTPAGTVMLIEGLTSGVLISGISAYVVDLSTQVYVIDAITRGVSQSSVDALAVNDTVTLVTRAATEPSVSMIFVIK